MNADVAKLQPHAATAPCAETVTQISESLQARERLLTASARASRLLLEAPDVRAAIPGVLGLIGEAARVDRVNLMQTRSGAAGERLLTVVSEWTAEHGTLLSAEAALRTCNEASYPDVFAELRAGRSVYFNKAGSSAGHNSAIEGAGTQTKAIVPIFVAGEFNGIVGFDNTQRQRAIDASELAALETAAGVIGAALHRERLVDDVRRERERAAEQRVAELAKANAVIRGNLERLAGETDLHSFMGHMLLEATRQFGASSGDVVVRDDSLQEWRVVAHVHDDQLTAAPYAHRVPLEGSEFTELYGDALRQVLYVDIASLQTNTWPGLMEYHRAQGEIGTVLYPMMFGGRSVGFLGLTFRRNAEEVTRSELLVALAQQATLAVQLTRLAHAAREAAVLMERTRIGQEIHDGLAQAFTGILLQLGAVEEFPSCRKRGSELAVTLSHIRELARDGLAEARRSVMALRLDQTRRAGLELALRQVAERSTVPGGVTCTFEGDAIDTGLKPEQEHELLRIAQEAVSNAVRHARPRTVRITMNDLGEYWELAVTDDGAGMEQSPELSARQGFGLASMRQRASAIGGEWQIASAPGHGTRVSVRMRKRA
ncbi:MAG TPA: GAF domain-containing sensor histidine kinase [Steroidobacteraceae bacterium]|nr:GAF domain-containing sensor histidine kinase [Steroidobacteraceae bacterium]